MKTDTRERLLAVAREIAQTGGLGALSFRDLASRLGIKDASVHYHFPTKSALADALLTRYAAEMARRLDEIAATTPDVKACVDAYVAIFRATLVNRNRMCLYTMSTAEDIEFGPGVRQAMAQFREVNIDWLARVLARDARAVAPDGHRPHAAAIFAAVEGAQVVAREQKDPSVFDSIVATYRRAGLLP